MIQNVPCFFIEISMVWGKTYTSNLHSLCILQKRAIRIVNDIGHCEHTNMLFFKSHVLKFMDHVEFKIMYKAKKKLLGNIQKMFLKREGGSI